ncbi:hypothetical protein BH09VER1_BH09VER1_31970 [soil metagenome]
MQTQQQQEFYKLTEAATQSLNSLAESSSFDRVFSYWRLPSFHDQTRTDLFTPRRLAGRSSFVAVTTWRRLADTEKLRDPVERLKYPRELEPTIEHQSTDVASDIVASVISDLSVITLPSIRPLESTLGLDGTSYRFFFNQGYFSLDFSWWCEGPEVWKGAARQIEEIVSRLESVG